MARAGRRVRPRGERRAPPVRGSAGLLAVSRRILHRRRRRRVGAGAGRESAGDRRGGRPGSAVPRPRRRRTSFRLQGSRGGAGPDGPGRRRARALRGGARRAPRAGAAPPDVLRRPRGPLDAGGGARSCRAVPDRAGRGRRRHLPPLVGSAARSADRPGRRSDRELPGVRLDHADAGGQPLGPRDDGRRPHRLRADHGGGRRGGLHRRHRGRDLPCRHLGPALRRRARHDERAVPATRGGSRRRLPRRRPTRPVTIAGPLDHSSPRDTVGHSGVGNGVSK